MSTALVKTPAATHLQRWAKKTALGLTVEEIAEDEGVEVRYVKSSLQKVEQWKTFNSDEMMKAAVTEQIIVNAPAMGKAIKGGLTAKSLLTDDKGAAVKDGKGNPVMVDDHATRAKYLDKSTNLINAMLPKAALIQNNNSMSTQVGVGIKVGGTTAGFETNLRAIRAKVDEENKKPSEVGNVIEAEELESEEDE